MKDNNKSYFGEIGAAMKTLATGMKVTLRDYFTPKSTEQYPENRKTTLHVSKRHRGRLVFKRNEDESYKCVGCTMCEKACPNDSIKITTEMVADPEIISMTLVIACSASCVLMLAILMLLSLQMILRTLCLTVAS